jgi:hypothetical protein
VSPHAESDLRGISIFAADACGSLEELRALVEQDPAIQAGRLAAEYFTWHHGPFPAP